MNHSEFEISDERIRRLNGALGDVGVHAGQPLIKSAQLCGRPWIGVTCSRLGKDTRLHGELCRFLSRCMMDCRRRNAVAVVAAGSAVESWALRAADLFGVDVIRLWVHPWPAESNEPAIMIESPASKELSRDRALVAIADRVDAIYVRPAGNVFESLSWRISNCNDASTRVAVINSKTSAAKTLIDAGAVGWFLAATTERQPSSTTASVGTSRPAVDPTWTRSDGEWLVHCTRTCTGPWPGQTEHQYQDELLLGEVAPHQRTPLDSLRRIVRSGRLVAGAIVSAKAWPVVCFSESPLRELLDRRCFRPHLQRWDYEPYGIAIRKRTAREIGIQPVIYAAPEQRGQFAADDQYRFQAVGKKFDWTQEREWRAAADVDLSRFTGDDIRVFVPSVDEAITIAGHSNWPVDVVSISPDVGKSTK